MIDAAWNLALPWLPALLLHVLRAGAFLTAQPLFGLHRASFMARVILALSLGSVFFWIEAKPIPLQSGLLGFGGLAVREVAIGLALGLAARMLTTGLVAAGEVLSHEMGFAMAQIVDPATGKSTAVFSRLLEVIGLLLIFELDLHHEVLRAFGAVYEFLPVGGTFDPGIVHMNLSHLVSAALAFGVRYALPVIGVMVLVTAMLVMLARAVQQINLLEFSFGLRILLALLAAAFFLPHGEEALVAAFMDTIERVALLFTET